MTLPESHVPIQSAGLPKTNMDQYAVSACPLCDQTSIRYEFFRDGFSVFKCDGCGFMFLHPQPSDETLAKLYGSSYSLFSEIGQDDEMGSAMKSATGRLYLDQLVRYLGKRGGNLFEIGCGQGDFLLSAREMGFSVQGVEVSEYAATTANRRLHQEAVICGDFETITLPENHYDVFALFDVLEYVRDPVAYLKTIYRYLKPDGVVFIVTPSLDSWSAKLMKHNWMEFKQEHLHYFDTQTIQNALAKTGFRSLYISPNCKYLRLDYINARFQRYRIPFFTRLIKGVTCLLPASLKSRNFKLTGSGINVLARKSEKRSIPLLSIIVPVYNEIKTFPSLINSLISKQVPGMEKEIIIVESNSDDGTREEALKYKDFCGIKLALEDRAKGKGHAVRSGLQYATGDFVMIQDGDLEYDLNDYDQLLEPLLKFQKAFVLGSRHLKGWKMRQFENARFLAFVMNLGQKIFKTILNLACGQNLNDPFTMFKIFRRDCLFGLTLKANRFDFDWEIVIKLLRKGYFPLEIPINYVSRSFKDGKKITFFRDPLLWIYAAIRFRFEKLYKIRYEECRKDEHELPNVDS
jgi:glycosyltransferase involved in cell wall biosynthesis/ubiquinone/menaquinone biosynthesis C-methylase UbiE